MTTSILAGKLMTIKLDKNEIVKVKCLRKSTLEEKHKIIGSLRDILAKQATGHMCRLCLRPGKKKIFNVLDSIVTNIKHILGIEIEENDGRPQHICKSCEDIIRAAAQLKQTAETTQWRLQQELDMVNEATLEPDEPLPTKHHGGYFNVKGPEVVREWKCGKCSKTFVNEIEFVEHEKTPKCQKHSKSYVCEICGLEFKSLFLVKRHRLIHSDDPGQFSCTFCPYRARTKYSVSVHERGHTGARPLACVCGKTFSSAARLWAHRRGHLPPQFHCHVCAKSFRFKQLLMDHIMSQHNSEKRFNCFSCGKAFATRKKALQHERRIHNRPRIRAEVEHI